jgi:hypothetical protein
MASQPVAADPNAELDPETIVYNSSVKALVEDIRGYAEDLENDMKLRQLPNGLVGKKVYGPQAGIRTNFNSAASLLKKLADITEKLVKGKSKAKTGALVGFAAPAYIKPEMAIALGLKEGSHLWPAGQRPIFSAAMITKFFTHRVLANGLVHDAELSRFSCDEMMTKLFQPFIYTSHKLKPQEPGQPLAQPLPPIDLKNLSYTDIQKLIKNFVEKRSKETPGPKLDEQLTAIFKQLEGQFAALKETKDKVKDAFKRVAKAQEDLIKAKASLDQGLIAQELFNGYAMSYQQINGEKEQIYALYRGQAKQMGI